MSRFHKDPRKVGLILCRQLPSIQQPHWRMFRWLQPNKIDLFVVLQRSRIGIPGQTHWSPKVQQAPLVLRGPFLGWIILLGFLQVEQPAPDLLLRIAESQSVKKQCCWNRSIWSVSSVKGEVVSFSNPSDISLHEYQ